MDGIKKLLTLKLNVPGTRDYFGHSGVSVLECFSGLLVPSTRPVPGSPPDFSRVSRHSPDFHSLSLRMPPQHMLQDAPVFPGFQRSYTPFSGLNQDALRQSTMADSRQLREMHAHHDSSCAATYTHQQETLLHTCIQETSLTAADVAASKLSRLLCTSLSSRPRITGIGQTPQQEPWPLGPNTKTGVVNCHHQTMVLGTHTREDQADKNQQNAKGHVRRV